jgi:hypothetical protein
MEISTREGSTVDIASSTKMDVVEAVMCLNVPRLVFALTSVVLSIYDEVSKVHAPIHLLTSYFARTQGGPSNKSGTPGTRLSYRQKILGTR